MDPVAIGGLALAVGVVVVKLVDKALPTSSDHHLASIAEATREMLQLQRSQREESRVDREQLKQILRSLERLETRLDRHIAEEDVVHRKIADHLTRIHGGVNT